MSNNVTAKPKNVPAAKAPASKALAAAPAPKKMPTDDLILKTDAKPTQKIARPARLGVRHYLIILSFLVWVVAPLTASAVYLYTVAKDQYASYSGFSVRKEDAPTAFDVLGGLTALSGNSSSSDTDILFAFIQGRQMIRAVQEQVDFSTIYGVEDDPVFSLKPDASIEELQSYWQRVVKVFYDSASGMIEIRVVAFTPQDAQNVATAIINESTRVINELSTVARDDVIRYASLELDLALERVDVARQAMTDFRNRTQIVDPQADTQGRMGLLNTLQTQLATTLIELDLIQSSGTNDPRIDQTRRRVEVIEARIAAERAKFGNSDGVETYSILVGKYQELSVNQKFAEESYLVALATYHSSVAEAQRKSRYLATYIPPTLAETAEYPQRFILLSLIGGFLLLSWAVAILIYYSVRDRR